MQTQTPHFDSPPGRLAGIDFGTVRVGIAISDARQTLASPHSVYRRGDCQADARFFRRLAADEQIAGFVVGLPVHLDGRESEKSVEARRFGRWLAETTGIAVTFFDERFTTSEADEMLGAARLSHRRRRQRRDMLAAQIMLTAYLESQARGETPVRALDE